MCRTTFGGNPIWPFMPTSSMGCAIFDTLIAIWLLARAGAAADVSQPESLDRGRQEPLSGSKKPRGVRQRRVQFETGFIDPLGVHGEDFRLTQRFKYIDPQTTRLGARRSIDLQQCIAEFRIFAGLGLKPRNEVKGQTYLLPVSTPVYLGAIRNGSSLVVYPAGTLNSAGSASLRPMLVRR